MNSRKLRTLGRTNRSPHLRLRSPAPSDLQEGCHTMKFLRFTWCLGLSFAASTCFAQSNPVPFVNQPVVPAAVAPSGPGFVLTVNGAGFVSGSVVNWNGTPLATTFVKTGELTAVVPATIVSKAGTASVTVVSPSPGGGSSNPVPFTIIEPTSK